MAIATDFSVASNGDIRHASGSTNYTVLQLHRYLQDLADNSTSSGDDLVDITSVNPSTRKTDQIITLNGSYNIDDTAAQYLYGGSIEQASGATGYYGLAVIGSVVSGTQLQVVQNNAILTSYWSTGINTTGGYLNRIMIKARSSSADVDFKQVRVFAREWGNTYSEFSVTLGLGEATAAINTTVDTFNSTASATIGALSITNTEGYGTIDLANGNGAQPYYSLWTRGANTNNQLYQFGKYIQRRGSASTAYGMNGQLFRGVTHSITYTSGAAYTQNEVVTWGSGATLGTGAVLAKTGTTAGTVYIQKLTGQDPVTALTMVGGTSGSSSTTGTITARTLPSTLIGGFFGNIVGGYGVGITAAQLTSADSLIDLTNTTQTPPNNQTFTVSSIVSGDRVLVATNDGSGGIKYNQFALAAGNTAGNGTLVVSTSIPSDTPLTGTVRAYYATGGYYDLLTYTSWTGSTFTLSGTLPHTLATSANAFITYIDKATSTTSESYTATYSTDRSLVVEVRNASTPIVPFITPATFSSTGGSVAAIRTLDS